MYIHEMQMAAGFLFLWKNTCKANVYKGLAGIMHDGKENGHSDYRDYIIGNAYSPISPYKQGLYRTHLINLYEFYTKTF